jgi:hypothetical protein
MIYLRSGSLPELHRYRTCFGWAWMIFAPISAPNPSANGSSKYHSGTNPSIWAGDKPGRVLQPQPSIRMSIQLGRTSYRNRSFSLPGPKCAHPLWSQFVRIPSSERAPEESDCPIRAETKVRRDHGTFCSDRAEASGLRPARETATSETLSKSGLVSQAG